MSTAQIGYNDLGHNKFRGLSFKYLEKAWSLIEPQEDWREPVVAWIKKRDFDACSKACEFYTATPLEVQVSISELVRDYERENDVPTNPNIGDDRILVRADGYRAGPAGP
ncbi:MAG: hypothetical protein ACR2NF_12290 [Pirellulales bacterium]